MEASSALSHVVHPEYRCPSAFSASRPLHDRYSASVAEELLVHENRPVATPSDEISMSEFTSSRPPSLLPQHRKADVSLNIMCHGRQSSPLPAPLCADLRSGEGKMSPSRLDLLREAIRRLEADASTHNR